MYIGHLRISILISYVRGDIVTTHYQVSCACMHSNYYTLAGKSRVGQIDRQENISTAILWSSYS